MAANLIQYEVVRVGPGLDDVRRALNEAGRRGYQLHHTQTDAGGVYTFILSKDTGRAPEGEEVTGEWIDDGFVNEETSWS